ncbi:MAG: PDZ domain-containing protein [Clostridia bacterium]|nr:PDZ domain-containing protein [Clostridia bacterium]
MHLIFSRIKPFAAKSAALVLAFALFAFGHGGAMQALRACPDKVWAADRAELYRKLGFSGDWAAEASASSDETLPPQAGFRLFGLITAKKVGAVIEERRSVFPGGEAVGISIRTRGVLIVGFGSDSGNSPAYRAGLRPGDVVISVNGADVDSAEQITALMSSASSRVTALRGGKTMEFTVERGEDGAALGAWVRDSTVGVGTLSFYNEEYCAALGHSVTDADTGRLLQAKSGALVYAKVLGVVRGSRGAPGEIQGTFGASSPEVGRVFANTELGVFASVTGELPQKSAMPVAFPDEVHEGEAVLLSSADGALREYSCRIVKAVRQSSPAAKGLVIEVTDERLICLTGGIVQGMSGSPVIQDGRLAGVVTHVFVNDPKKGYGAYAYWILKAMEGS